MQYRTFHASRIGAAHLRSGLPCQDCSTGDRYSGWLFAAVADGHGNRRHFRSQTGADIACRVAFEAFRRLVDGPGLLPEAMDARLGLLKEDICLAWRDEVLGHWQAHPWTEAELAEEQALLTPEQYTRLLDGSDAHIAYGTTLCLAFAGEEVWGAVQIGDGCAVRVSADGEYSWPMPASTVNQGNRTASLCMADPMRDFRHCWGTDRPVGILLCTDGVEKSFPERGDGIVGFLHWVWKNGRDASENRADDLDRMLDLLTNRSSIGDDVSVAGIVDANAADMEPRPGRDERMADLERLRARVLETENTIAFNVARLARLTDADKTPDMAAQLQAIIDRKRDEVRQLREEEASLAEALGVPVMAPTEDSTSDEAGMDDPLWDDIEDWTTTAEISSSENEADEAAAAEEPDAREAEKEPTPAPKHPSLKDTPILTKILRFLRGNE